jgi:hypothetical protein
MALQDYIFGIGQLLLFAALIPSILSNHKPALSTSLITATIVSIFVFTFATLDLWFGAISTATIAIGWWILAIQKWRRK